MYILYNKRGGLSAKALANSLGIKKSKTPLYGENPVIVWGESRYNVNCEWNNPFTIHIVANKVRFSNYLENKLPENKFIKLNTGIPERYPVVIRTKIASFGGRGIVIARNEKEFYPYFGNYWSEFYRFQREFGVHFFNGEVIKIMEKVPVGEMEEPEFPIRNSDRGYRFSLRKVEDFPEISELIRQFTATLPIKFGRLDVGVEENGNVRIIECNSAPGIADNSKTLNLYAELFRATLF